MKTRIKIAAFVSGPDEACWPHIGYDFDGELEKIISVVKEYNKDTDFDVVKYYPGAIDEMETSWDNDKEIYDGVAVISLTCVSVNDLLFYARKEKNGGIPSIIFDLPFGGTGGVIQTSTIIKEEKLHTPVIMSTDYKDIGQNIGLFSVIKRMKDTNVLVIASDPAAHGSEEEAAHETWGVSFVNKTVDDFYGYFENVSDESAREKAEKWMKDAQTVVEPTEEDIIESARIYLALQKMKTDLHADAVTVDCLELSYRGSYHGKEHMYPCLSHFEMNCHGEVAVCEADICATVTSLLVNYLTGRPGYVSDPVIDTSRGEIIYSHCVACTKVFGINDTRTCPYMIRSHAEDHKGASVQVIFPENEQLTTVMFDLELHLAAIHNAVSCGNMESEMGCRSKLVAKTNVEAVKDNFMGRYWHRVTVFGQYRLLFRNVFLMKGYRIIEEDK